MPLEHGPQAIAQFSLGECLHTKITKARCADTKIRRTTRHAFDNARAPEREPRAEHGDTKGGAVGREPRTGI